MRGLLVCVLTVVLMVSVRGSPTKEEIISMIKTFGDKCLEERKINLTDADQELLKLKKCPNSDEAKCWLTCLSEHFDLLKEDKKFSPEKAMTSIKKAFDDQEKVDRLEKVVNTCDKEVAPLEGCEVGYGLCECMSKHAKEGSSKEDLEKDLKRLTEECIQEQNLELTDKDKEDMKKKVCPSSDVAKCMLTCVEQKAGWMDGQQFSLNKTKEAMGKFFRENEAILKLTEQFIEYCHKKVGHVDGECGAGYRVCECMVSQSG